MPSSGLRTLKSLDDLKVIDRLVEAKITEDPEVLDFMVENRVSALWQELMAGANKPAEMAAVIARVRALDGGVHVRAVRDQFLQEYEAAAALPLPADYDFRDVAGQRREPNPMQRLTASRLLGSAQQ